MSEAGLPVSLYYPTAWSTFLAGALLAPPKSIPIQVAAGQGRLEPPARRSRLGAASSPTSNPSPEFVRRRLDPSYIRAGRVDLELGFG